MPTTAEPDTITVAPRADDRRAATSGRSEEPPAGPAAGEPVPPPVDGAEPVALRIALALGFPVIGTAAMLGGVFTGVGARVYAVVAGVLGLALAERVSRSRRALLTNVVVVGGLFGIGLLMIAPSGFGNVVRASSLASSAAKAGDVLRPPVPLTPGWQAVIGWLMAIIGFVTGWIGIKLRRASIALLVPLPMAAVAGISVPKSEQVASGIAVLVLFAVGLGLLASSTALGEGDERPPLAYEVRKAVRSLPLIGAITVALIFLAQTSFLFPRPLIDPTQQPQKPKTVPLSKVPDRVLFEVQSTISGPWRIGSLDVYDGTDWRLPPFAQSELRKVPRSGVVDRDLTAGVKATFRVAGLGGTVLPALPNTVGIVASGPRLAYDARSGNIRVDQGVVSAGLEYTVTAPGVPTVEDLEKLTFELPRRIQTFALIPGTPPPAASDLIRQAPKASKWDEFDFLRTYLLDHVTVAGAGTPKSITADRVQDMLAGSKQASPFELVAAQAMMARWIGVPSRIGYGFDGGDVVGERLQVRPRNGATFVEVWFPSYKWLPVIGVPKMAKPTVGNTGEQQFDPSVLPSNDISVKVFLPTDTPPKSVTARQIRDVVGISALILLLLALAYWTYPAAAKGVMRSRRRADARAHGARARLLLAYAEFRDLATDFGFSYPTDTPLMFMRRFADDPEHAQLSWLVTRALWGDLAASISDDMAADAEELAKALQRRLAGAQPVTVRMVAAVSRLSLRSPYGPPVTGSAAGPGRLDVAVA